MKIKVSEITSGIQGEGIHAGKPSIFVRLFGCNLRCPSLGVEGLKETVRYRNKEIKIISQNIIHFKTLDDLPALGTGCDSYFSVYPEFKSFSKDYKPDELISEIQKRHSKKAFCQFDVVFTGGEPLLQQMPLGLVIARLDENKLNRITFETNGTLLLHDEFIDGLNESSIDFTFSVSPKLRHSGHPFFETFRSDAVRTMNRVKKSKVILNFVISRHYYNEDELFSYIKGYMNEGIDIKNIFLMGEGGINNENFLLNSQLAVEICCKYGFMYSPRHQVTLGI